MINNSTKIQSIIDAILASLQIQTYDNAVSDFNHPQEIIKEAVQLIILMKIMTLKEIVTRITNHLTK